MSNAKTIEAAVDAILSTAGVRFTATGGQRTRHADWDCFAWQVSFGPETFEYFAGLAHAVPRRAAWAPVVAKAPTAAAVLYCLILDGAARSQSFADWCADLGMSDDSLSAFDTYRACCDIGRKLECVFSRDTLAALREALQDY